MRPGQHSAYRVDIDGLRALAVTSVVAFHAFPGFLKGGFVGVDIFFVISGFLITGIVYGQIAANTFSIRTFYAARIKRIFPALAFVLVACIGIGWAVLLEDELRQFGLHAAAGAGFVSNVALWREAGYFDQSSELKPLLHLWSLGIEEQFYIFWPLLLAWFVRKKAGIALSIGTLATLSFMLNIALVETHQATAFFLPFPRFWELMAGSLLAYFAAGAARWKGREDGASAAWQEFAAFLGLALVVGAIALVDRHYEFPGWWAIPPVLGTLLLIIAGPRTWIARRLLSHPGVVFIGLISYPLYLWHWPLLSFATIIGSGLPPLAVRCGLVALAVVLAALTYRFVELPIRSLPRNCRSHNVAVGGLALAVMAIFIAGVSLNRGVPEERLDGLRVLSDARNDWGFPGDRQASMRGDTEESVLFFGDSYIQQLYPLIARVDQQSRGHHRTVRFITAGGCAPIPEISRKSEPACIEYVRRGFELAEADSVKAVVIGGSWLGMLERGDYYDALDPQRKNIDFNDAERVKRVLLRWQVQLGRLRQLDKEVFVVLHPPGGRIADPGILTSSRLHGDLRPEVKEISMADHLQRTGAINRLIRTAAENAGATVIDPAEWICSQGRCRFTDAEGVPFFKDATHFRAAFVRCCVRTFDGIIAPARELQYAADQCAEAAPKASKTSLPAPAAKAVSTCSS